MRYFDFFGVEFKICAPVQIEESVQSFLKAGNGRGTAINYELNNLQKGESFPEEFTEVPMERIKETKGTIFFRNKLCFYKVDKEIQMWFYYIEKWNSQFVFDQILFGIYLFFFQRGYFFIHSVAVEYNKKIILISGRSGSGKTTLAHHLQPGRVLSDDLNFVNSSYRQPIMLLPSGLEKNVDIFFFTNYNNKGEEVRSLTRAGALKLFVENSMFSFCQMTDSLLARAAGCIPSWVVYAAGTYRVESLVKLISDTVF